MAFYQTPPPLSAAPPQVPLSSSVAVPPGDSAAPPQAYDTPMLAQTPSSQSSVGPPPPPTTSSSSTPPQATNAFTLVGDRQRTSLWMGELEPYMDENFIKHVWYRLGETVQVKMIRDRYTGGFANYCFVEMASQERATHALSTYNNQLIPDTDKVFRLNWASGGNAGSTTTTSHTNGVGSSNINNGGSDMDRSPEFSIFIGDLAPEVTEQMLLTLFQSYYKSIKTAKVVIDTATGTPKGYGFVRFYDESEQHRALNEMQGVYCGSRQMRISMATPKNRPGGPLGPAITTGTPMYTTAGGMMTPMMTHPTQTMEYNQFTDPNNTTVFVGGLTGYTSEDDLRSAFSKIGEVTYVKIPPGKNCGFVQFLHRPCAEQAISQMNGCLIGTSRVRLSWGRPQHIPPSATTPFSRVTPTFTAPLIPMASMTGMTTGVTGMTAGMANMNGMNGTNGMNGMNGMTNMTNMTNMTGMTGMTGMAGMTGVTGLPGYPNYYPAPVMAPVMQGVFPAQPQQVMTSPIPQPHPSFQMMAARDPREMQPIIQTNNQFVRDREDAMLSLDFVGPTVTA